MKVNKLKISLKDLEAQRDEAAQLRAESERKKRQQEDQLLMTAERAKIKIENGHEVQETAETKPIRNVGKLNLDYEGIIAKKSAQEKQTLTLGMKDKMDAFKNLRYENICLIFLGMKIFVLYVFEVRKYLFKKMGEKREGNFKKFNKN